MLAVAMVAALLVLPADTCAQGDFALLIEDRSGSVGPLCLPLACGEGFSLLYTHSVDLLPVAEQFFNDGGDIVLAETWFDNFGAGMGLTPGRGRYVESGLRLGIVAIDEVIDPFLLRTGPISDHRLYHRGGSYALREIFGSQPRLLLRIVRGIRPDATPASAGLVEP